MSTETGSDISTTVDRKEVFVNKAKDNYNKHATFSDAWFQFNGTILKLQKKKSLKPKLCCSQILSFQSFLCTVNSKCTSSLFNDNTVKCSSYYNALGKRKRGITNWVCFGHFLRKVFIQASKLGMEEYLYVFPLLEGFTNKTHPS